MARTPQEGRPQGSVQVLSTAPPEKVEFQHTIGDGPTPATVDPYVAAPIVASAIREREDIPKPAPFKRFQVAETKHILDKTMGTRTKLHAGKEISAQHYDVRDLQRQGVKLREIPADTSDTEPLPMTE